MTSFVEAYTAGPTTTCPGVAADWSRAAVFTASPVSIRSREPPARSRSTSTSPASTPTRISSSGRPSAANERFSSDRTACISSPARTARSGSSSCAEGTPNTASTASPTNFSISPPYRSISAESRSNARPTSPWTTSGSSRSASSVDPTMSANRAVANFRSCREAVGCRGRRAVQAEPGSVGVLLTAGWTRRHRPSLCERCLPPDPRRRAARRSRRAPARSPRSSRSRARPPSRAR